MEKLRQSFDLNTLLRVLDLKRSTYYYESSHLNDDRDKEIKDIITSLYTASKGTYGYRSITLALGKMNLRVNHKKVKRLMKVMGLFGITPKAKYRSYKGDMNGTVKNLLLDKKVDEEKHKTSYKQNFSTLHLNEKWTTDVSEFHIASGKLYLSPILDMHNNEIVSYDVSLSPDFTQIKRMLDGAFKKYDDLSGLIFHSDQGWQYQMQAYHKALKDKGIIQSMSRKGNCMDNGIMEQFFGKIKNEMFYGHEHEFLSLDDLKKAIDEYIEYYNNKRVQHKLKGLTPCEARNQALSLS